ncbi:Uncharacterised protein [Sphingobacterium daejeonense]|nr:Uncharacterised protein [Sphingobacterium daejeonense]
MAKKKVQYQDKTKFNESNNHITGKWTNTDANELKRSYK